MSDKVIPIFILDDRQVAKHSYRSIAALEFMCDALIDLDKSLRKYGSQLAVFNGVAEEVITEVIQCTGAQAVFVNRDITPFSRSRDGSLHEQCKAAGINFYSCDDTMLHAPEIVVKKDGLPYTIFTPYYKSAIQLTVRQPAPIRFNKFTALPVSKVLIISAADLIATLKLQRNPHLAVRGGRTAGLAILSRMGDYMNYNNTRDRPDQDGTTRLSAYLKFGCVSAREVWYTVHDSLGSTHPLCRQLYWRDFYYQIVWNFPRVFGAAFQQKYDQIKWKDNPAAFKAWHQGLTGFPLIDAGMRELNRTGFMHNRVRMVVASFFTKDLHIDWRKGERYFAQHLVDYDPAVNNGSWQWAASTGCDAQPYFRIFNPWLQQKKFDPDAIYIHRWVPELNGLSASEIHNLLKQRPANLKYPMPIVDHATESAQARKYYASC
ncbi:MAG: deoxyribodipyrimidine photo-lyase [Nitrosomonas sp.]|nr:MAG: deoxyribodipyrimidine photo-lyase [Nitrosomonas sp.]